MQTKYREYEKSAAGVNELEDFIQENEDGFAHLSMKDNLMLDVEEPEFGDFELVETESTDDQQEEEEWTPDEHFRLLYVYFKNMAVEPLLTPREEIEVSAKIKKCEARAREIRHLLDRTVNGNGNGNGTKTKRNGHKNGKEKEILKRIER
ncbi:MAG: hypothetical protein ACREOB_05505, partial [Thermodesulfobacteriota bacterium]